MAFTINTKGELTKEVLYRLRDVTKEGTTTKAIYKAVDIVVTKYLPTIKRAENAENEAKEWRAKFENLQSLVKQKNSIDTQIMRLSVNFPA